MKKRGFGEGRWNGAGGKVHDGESLEDAMIRETREELGVTPRTYEKVAELSFAFPHEPSFDQLVHVYLGTAWDGEPQESDEMRPHWFKMSDIPYSDMWPGDNLWIPQVLEGENVRGSLTFAPGDHVQDHHIEVVSAL